MRFQEACATFLGLTTLVASVPTDGSSDRRGLKWKSRAQKRSPLVIQQNIQETNIVIVQDNQAEVDALRQVAEQQFAQLVQAQVALGAQLQAVKDNIRVNHFKARFAQSNTVIVTVTTVVDARAEQGNQNRYMVNQLVADNGKPDQEIRVMISDLETMTVGASQTVDLAGVQASAVSAPTGAPELAAADPAAPFGRVNQSVVLQIGAAAPSNDVVFIDPAAIILPNQNNLFVESTDTFLQDCGFYQANGQVFANLGSQVFTSFQTIVVNGQAVSIVQQKGGVVSAPGVAASPAAPPVGVAPPAETAPPAEVPAETPPAEAPEAPPAEAQPAEAASVA